MISPGVFGLVRQSHFVDCDYWLLFISTSFFSSKLNERFNWYIWPASGGNYSEWSHVSWPQYASAMPILSVPCWKITLCACRLVRARSQITSKVQHVTRKCNFHIASASCQINGNSGQFWGRGQTQTLPEFAAWSILKYITRRRQFNCDKRDNS